MLQLTVNQSNRSDVYQFEKNRVVIGSLGDLNLPDLSLQEIHLQIEVDAEKIRIINAANDPFMTLDGAPFGKRVVTQGIIEIEGAAIHVALSKTSLSSTEELAAQQDLEKMDVEKLFQEVVRLGDPAEKAKIDISLPAGKNRKEEKRPSAIYNDLVFSSEKNPANWIWCITGVVVLTAVLSVILSFFYWRAASENRFSEHEISAALSDLAMTLVYVKVNQIAPLKQDWSHPLFLQQNLSKMLPSRHHSFAQIDSQGRFTEKPYLLRVYTEPELSRFLIIAQPSSTFFEKVAPRAAVAIDSRMMELKKINDIKTLNRLLANPHPLKGSNGELISEVVQQGGSILLDSLDEAFPQEDFLPPQALGFVYPEAQQKIYNAPRYYRIAESFVDFMFSFSNTVPTAQNMVILNQLLESFEEMPHLIIYASNGLKEADDLNQLLAAYAPQKSLLIGYLTSMVQGHISSHLLLQEPLFPGSSVQEIVDEAVLQKEVPYPERDHTTVHPLVLQMRALLAERQRVLQPIGDELVYLFVAHTQTPIQDFSFQMSKLVQLYRDKDRDQNRLIALRLEELFREDYSLSPDEFISFVEQVGLKSALGKLPLPRTTHLFSSEVEVEFKKIQEAQSFSALEEYVQKILELSSLQKLEELNLLIYFQNELRTTVLRTLKRMLLSPEHLQVKKEERGQLLHLMARVHIHHPEVVDYFLQEYDALTQKAD